MNLLAKANNALTRQIRYKTARSRLDAPIASFTFDDFPRSAWTVGGPLLERYGARATYYAAGRFCGRHEDGLDYYEADDLRAIRAAGHEVGCHTFSHRSSPKVGSADLQADWDRNVAFVREALGQDGFASFAFPYGDASPRTKKLASARFPVSRSVYSGVNSGEIDLAQLRAVPLEIRNWKAAEVEARVAEAVRSTGWIVFFSHDVSDSPSPYGATPEMLEHALATVRAAGIDILPVREALGRVLG